MDRYDRVIRDVIEETRGGVLRWTIASPRRVRAASPAPGQVGRLFLCKNYDVSGINYDLTLFEARARVSRDPWDETGDFDDEVHLHVLDGDGETLLALYDGVVEEADLLELLSLVLDANEGTKAFFDAFERSGRGAGGG